MWKKKPELLSPAGDRERLEAAVNYGADAVYLAGKSFGMRSAPANFGPEELAQAVDFCHQRGVKVYVTCNTLPRNQEFEELPSFLTACQDMGVDAFIISDLGVLALAGKVAPQVERHISTQTGIVNYAAAQVCWELGAKRVVLAREVPLSEIQGIRENTDPGLELEAFVHGAMCMSFSGRCVISNYMTGRDANRGECAQPCRWEYHLVEAQRPGCPVQETSFGMLDPAWLSALDAPAPPAAQSPSRRRLTLTVGPDCPPASLERFLSVFARDTRRIRGFVPLSDGMYLADCVGPQVRLEPDLDADPHVQALPVFLPDQGKSPEILIQVKTKRLFSAEILPVLRREVQIHVVCDADCPESAG